MSTTRIKTPASHLRFGLARVDVTPPVGIYHRVWGAAKHDRSTGVHRPLYADVMALQSPEGADEPIMRIQLDLVGLVQEQFQELRQRLCRATGVPDHRLVIAFSHSHAAGWFVPDRVGFPGGEMIAPYLDTLGQRLEAGCSLALASREDVLVSYATGRCDMAANRDYWDEGAQRYACGLNPDGGADDTLILGRVTHVSGRLICTIVHYACHPTTLAFQNALLSPDFVGAARATVEGATGAPCVYLQGCCGDLGPRRGYTGDVGIADQNGRQVGYAALAALGSLGQAGHDLAYQGPLVSGATLGIWGDAPFDAQRKVGVSQIGGGSYTTDLPLKPRPDPAVCQRELDQWSARQHEAEAGGDAAAARDAAAYAERARRWLARFRDVPPGETHALGYSVFRLGDAIWITTGGEPYSLLQREVRSRFPDYTILASPLAGNLQVAYILPKDRFGIGLYQEEVASLGPGSLELLIEAICARITELIC